VLVAELEACWGVRNDQTRANISGEYVGACVGEFEVPVYGHPQRVATSADQCANTAHTAVVEWEGEVMLRGWIAVVNVLTLDWLFPANRVWEWVMVRTTPADY
jgi:hypothetical protein